MNLYSNCNCNLPSYVSPTMNVYGNNGCCPPPCPCLCPTGATGADGASAYDVAVDNGFVGTEDEWLTSLKGMTGATGATGATGDTGPTGPETIKSYAGMYQNKEGTLSLLANTAKIFPCNTNLPAQNITESTYYFIITVSGVYDISYMATFDSSADTHIDVMVRKNKIVIDGSVVGLDNYDSITSLYSGGIITKLNIDDTVELAVIAADDTTLSFGSNQQTSGYLRLFKLN